MMRGMTVAIALACSACDPSGLGRSNPDFRIVGHRGAPLAAPENTLRSFEVAVALGANAIETDVCLTRDDVFVIWHDADPDSVVALARQSGAEGLAYVPRVPNIDNEWRRPVRELTLDELRAHYGYGDPLGALDPTAQIPLVRDVIEWARNETRLRWIYWDIKVPSTEEATRFIDEVSLQFRDESLVHVTPIFLHVARETAAAMEAERVRVGGERFRVAWDHEVPGALENTIGVGLRDVSTGLTPAHTYFGYKREVAELVSARERGEIDSVTVWTFDDEMKLAELLYYSVDGVMTNDPGLLYRMWRSTMLAPAETARLTSRTAP